ncbi:hypothetical protein E8E13_003925 [Curvularia kusanoi]|uniref:Uncharacterized protein n=1 Tax=Curvularia kusanoi TaxID=90978 RepID=A0A9P4TGR7_CURKU|nr:hypothetical protein E8E13_003925 [Curvularia kusanoi]
MASRPSTPENRHDDAAAALIELSQSGSRATVKHKTPEAAVTIEGRLTTSSPVASSRVFEVSDSDDEDLGGQADTLRRRGFTAINRNAPLHEPRVYRDTSVRTQQSAGVHLPSRLPRSEITHDLTARGGANNVVFRLPSGAANEDDRRLPPVGLFSDPKMQGSDAGLGSSEPNAARPMSQTTAMLPARGISAAKGSLVSRAKTTRPLTSVEADHEQLTQQPRQQPGTVVASRLATPVLDNEAQYGQHVSERANTAGIKRETTPPPRATPAKRPRTGRKLTYAQTTAEVAKLAYPSCKAINMPLPQNKPTPNSSPFGADIDHQTGMLLYWLDIVEMTYHEATRRYHTMFPREKPSEDTIRKKHHVALAKLKRRYGPKPEDQLEQASRVVARRGQATGRRYDKIKGKAVYGPADNADAEGSVQHKKIIEPNADRGFLKACICVWKDTSKTTFDAIAQKLRNDYNWHLNASTVQKLYYSERQRVYGMFNDSSHSDEEAQDDEDDNGNSEMEDIEED